MRVLVAEQIATENACAPVGEICPALAVFTGLVMLESDAAHAIAQEQQEIVMVVVVRTVKLVGLGDELLVLLHLVGRELQVLLLVSEQVEMDRVCRRWREVDALEVDAGVER